jgi:S-DNA-T family DNA segregation ATPase FtsK/SpoIIIE
VRGGPCAVYGLDFGARGLAMLDTLPHVGSIVAGDDDERIERLVRGLRATIDERAERYAATKAGNVVEYRDLADAPDERRVLLLVDGLAAFRERYELGPRARTFDQFLSIARDGRPVGVHVAMTADRPAAVPASLLSSVPVRLVLRAADDGDLAALGVSADAFDAQAPPGRGYVDGTEVQVAVLGGEEASVAGQSAAAGGLAAAMRRAGAAEVAPVERLPSRVALVDLADMPGDQVVIGLADETLGPVSLPASGTFLVCGPPGSGRSTTLQTAVQAIQRAHPHRSFVHLSERMSPLAAQPGWTCAAIGSAAVAELATGLTAAWRDGEGEPDRQVIVIESVADFLNGPADLELQDLIRVARTRGGLVIVEGETPGISQSWPLLKEARASRQGIALQPDQTDGDAIFGTPFGRVRRAEFPEGRGMLVGAGRAARVQVAVPD